MPFSLSSILAGALRAVWQRRGDLVAYAFLPVILVSISRTLLLWLAGDWQALFEQPDLGMGGDPGALPAPPPPGEVQGGEGGDVASGDPGAPPAAMLTIAAHDVVASLISLFAGVLFAVAWFRHELLPNQSATVGAALRWGKRHWLFLGRVLVLMFGGTLLLTLIARLMTAAAGQLSALFLMVALAVAGLIAGRLLLALPATAIDDTETGFRRSWELTKGCSWRMFALFALPLMTYFMLGLLITSLLLTLIAATTGPAVSALLVLVLVQEAVAFAGIAVVVSGLALAYTALTDPARPTV